MKFKIHPRWYKHFIGFETDSGYYEKANERIEAERKVQRMF